MAHDREKEQHDVRVVNRAAHIAMGHELGRWRSTLLAVASGGGMIALIGQVEHFRSLIYPMASFGIAAALAYLSIVAMIDQQRHLHEHYAEELINTPQGWQSDIISEAHRIRLLAATSEKRAEKLSKWSIGFVALGFALMIAVFAGWLPHFLTIGLDRSESSCERRPINAIASSEPARRSSPQAQGMAPR